MKAVILAAGKGTRMLPLTETIPKVLIEVNGKPFLQHLIERVQEAGFDEIGIVVGYLGEKIKQFCSSNNIQATFIHQDEPKGTGHALLQAKEFCGSDNFVMLAGDHLWSVEDLKKIIVDDDLNYVSAIEVDNPAPYGRVVVDDGMLVRIAEKITEDLGNLINVSLYKFTSEIWDVLEKIEPSPRGEYELTDAVNLLAGRVKVLVLADYWLDLQGKEDIEKIEEFLQK